MSNMTVPLNSFVNTADDFIIKPIDTQEKDVLNKKNSLQFKSVLSPMFTKAEAKDFSAPVFGSSLSVNPYPIIWEHGTENLTDSVAAVLTFQVKNGAKGETKLTLSYINGEAPYNTADESVNFALADGIVNIQDYIPGDANGDGNVTTKDATRIKQHVAGWNVTLGGANLQAVYENTDQETAQLADTSTDAPKIIIDNQKAKVGDLITVPVKFQNNPGITGFSLQIGYDAAVLELTNAEAGDFSSPVFGQSLSVNPYPIIWEHGTENLTGTVAAVLTFRVLNIASGSTKIEISYRNNEAPYNTADEDVIFEPVNGVVEIVSAASTPTPETTNAPTPTPATATAYVIQKITASDGGFEIRIANYSGGDAVLWVASYTDNGKMTDSVIKEIQIPVGGADDIRVNLNAADTDMVKVFVLDAATFRPICVDVA